MDQEALQKPQEAAGGRQGAGMTRRGVFIVLVLALAGWSAWLVLTWLNWGAASHDHVEIKLERIQPGRADLLRECGSFSGVRVFLVLGQSNAANHGEPRGVSLHGQVWSNGHCYALADPLPGGTGAGGSVWPRLADTWFARTGERSLFILLGVDATSVVDWVSNAGLAGRLDELLAQLQSYGLKPDAVLWQQGEADARRGTETEDYEERLAALIARWRAGGVSSPVFLARSTQCRSAPYQPVRMAIARLADVHQGVFVGADADTIPAGGRHDGCHFNAAGLEQAAAAWVEALLEAGALSSLASP